ncbi:MAG: putative glycosyltransferase, group 1 family protein [Candidatus Eremiobacteraeota bacterium]|nr:putative glycosyltransferase, group 1 family protein [Candidatus Eremiobacteraeota bacterium]
MSEVHVAVDAHNLARDDRGIGRYARAVLSRALRDPRFRWTFVVRDLFPNRGAIARALGGAAVDVARRIPRDADVVWFPWNGTFLRTDVPSVATVHDAAPFAFPAADARRRATEQTPFIATANTARKILVQSAFTASEVERWLGVEPERIVVTPLAVDSVFSPGGAGALPAELRGKRYVLHVGAHDERKNSATLIDGFADAFRGGDVMLAFTRKPGVLPPGGIVVDARDDATLVALYRGAALVAVPSTYEGFGLPLLEAMACGAPVLAARAGSLPEVGGDAAAWVDDAHDPGAWAERLRALLDDDAALAALARCGSERAAVFSWDRCTAQTLTVLGAVAAQR